MIFKDLPDRVTVVVLKVNRKDSLTIIQTYAPTSTATDTEINKFYKDLHKSQTEFSNLTWLLTMGDFNSKIGTKYDGEELLFFISFRGTNNLSSLSLLCIPLLKFRKKFCLPLF